MFYNKDNSLFLFFLTLLQVDILQQSHAMHYVCIYTIVRTTIAIMRSSLYEAALNVAPRPPVCPVHNIYSETKS